MARHTRATGARPAVVTDRGRPTVLLVDDHVLFVESLALALGQAEHLQVRVAASTRAAAVIGEVVATRPDLVLLDLDLGEHGTAEPLIAALARRDVRVVVLTGTRDELRHAVCFEAGAIGVLVKDIPVRELVTHVTRIVRGGPAPGRDRRERLLAALQAHRRAEDDRLVAFAHLTPRETHVLGQLLAGKRVGQIAAEANVATATVRTQVRAVLTKLDVRSQVAAVAKARDAGWRPPA